MNKATYSLASLTLMSALLLVSPGVHAGAGAAAVFGSGMPAASSDLPAGEFRSTLESLPEAEQSRALQWLQAIEFAGEDLASMKLDSQGGIYYADSFNGAMPEAAMAGKDARPGKQSATAAAVPELHSNPGAGRRIFIDFGGGVISDTAWNTNAGVAAWDAVPYDLDNRPDAFSDAEIAAMVEIWQRVAEDFAPFDVDVTTEAPSTMDGATSWIMITHSTAGNSQPLPEPASGSVAYMNVSAFSLSGYYSPALVYYNNLGSPATVAEASAHAAGHLFGLSHDAVPSSAPHGSHVSWSPIMGVGPFGEVSQWSNGDYSGATNRQNDIGILFGSLGRRHDDHDDSRFGKGTSLQVDAHGRVTASTPANDPANRHSANKGVIESQDDIDVFVFDAAAGMVDLTVTPAWLAFGSAGPRGANLDVKLTLFDANGRKLLEQDPLDETAAAIRTHVKGGRYLLEVSAVGNRSGAYSTYGSLGQYFINGSIPAADAADRVAFSAR